MSNGISPKYNYPNIEILEQISSNSIHLSVILHDVNGFKELLKKICSDGSISLNKYGENRRITIDIVNVDSSIKLGE